VAAGIAALSARKGGSPAAVSVASATTGGESQATDQLVPGVEPLHALMTAITTSARASPLATERTLLAQQLAQFELGRIAALAEGRQLKHEFLCHMAGFITLAGGVATNALADIIASEQAALHWQGAGDVPELAEALRDAMSEVEGKNGNFVPPVLPNLIGEAAILAALQEQSPEAQAATVCRARTAGGRRCIATVIRTAQDFAKSRDHPSLSWLDALVDQADELAELIALSDELPDRSSSMIERAAKIEQKLVDAQRTMVIAKNKERTEQLTLARFLRRLASRLRDVYRLEEARAAAAEAVDIHRALEGHDRASPTVGNFSQSLLTLSGANYDLGRREEALAASAEAVQCLRQHLQPTLQRQLAEALSIMAAHLSSVGRREEALAASEESVGLHRDLAATHPEIESPPLAMALLNLAFFRSDVGSVEQALAAAEESVAILDRYAQSKPDAYSPAYAQALNSTAIFLAHTNKLAEALDRSRKAIAIQRTLVEGCPEAFEFDLALMLNGLASALRQSGDMEAAGAALNEAVEILRKLASDRPEAFLPELAKQLNNQAIVLINRGQTQRALEVGNEAVAILRAAQARRPDRHDEDLATAHVCLAFTQQATNNVRAMRDCAAEAVLIRRKLAARWPTMFRLKLARSLLVLAEALKQDGCEEEAEATAAEAATLNLAQ
jgi:tetratricopeptide (TPR) repeat protein